MKKIYLLMLFSIFFGINLLNADCITAKKAGENLPVILIPPNIDNKEISVVAILETDEIYFQVTNNYDGQSGIHKNTANGESQSFEFVSPDIYKDVKYTFDVYYSDGACGKDPIKTYEITTGIFNKYNESEECLNATEYIDRCKEHYTTDDIKNYNGNQDLTEEEFNELVKEDIKNGTTKPDDRTTKQKLIDIIKEYYLYVVIPVVVVSIVYIIIIIIVKRKKRMINE